MIQHPSPFDLTATEAALRPSAIASAEALRLAVRAFLAAEGERVSLDRLIVRFTAQAGGNTRDEVIAAVLDLSATNQLARVLEHGALFFSLPARASRSAS